MSSGIAQTFAMLHESDKSRLTHKGGAARIAEENSSIKTLADLQKTEKDVVVKADTDKGESAAELSPKNNASKPQLPYPKIGWGGLSAADENQPGLISIIGKVLCLQAKTNSNFWSTVWKQASSSMMMQVKFAPVMASAIEASYDAQSNATLTQATQDKIMGGVGISMFGLGLITTVWSEFTAEENPMNAKDGDIGFKEETSDETSLTKENSDLEGENTKLENENNKIKENAETQDREQTAKENKKIAQNKERIKENNKLIDKNTAKKEVLGKQNELETKYNKLKSEYDNGNGNVSKEEFDKGEKEYNTAKEKNETELKKVNGEIKTIKSKLKTTWEKTKAAFGRGQKRLNSVLDKGFQRMQMMQMAGDASSKLASVKYETQRAGYQAQEGSCQALSKEADQYSQFYGQDFSRQEELRQGSSSNIDYAMNTLKSAADTITSTVTSMFRG